MESHPASLEIDVLREQCEVRFQRRSGPGGQHRNKVETMVHLTHRPSGVEASASERRQQAQNLAMALERLRVRLALQIRCPWSKPSEVWQARCRGGRIQVSQRHDDFARCLAESLDALAVHDWQHSQAAEQLACSASQLIRFLKQHPPALKLLNDQRAQCGLRPLK